MSSVKTRQIKRSASEIINDIQSYYDNEYYYSHSWAKLKNKWRVLSKEEQHQYIIEDAFADYIEYKMVDDFDFIHPEVHLVVLEYMENLCKEIRYKLKDK